MAAKKPTALKLLQGVPGGQKRISEDEPKPEIKKQPPRCPPHLSKAAKRHWRKLAPRLHKVGLLTEADELAFEALCEAYARWRAALKRIDEEGEVFRTSTGYEQQSPHLQIANKAAEQMHKGFLQFGMTPASRTTIRGEK